MKLCFAGRVEKGHRKTNDDRALLCGEILDMNAFAGDGDAPALETVCDAPALAAVCDGCGGYSGGGFAAQSVLETLAAVPPEALLEEEALTVQLERAAMAVRHRQQELPQFSKMCTTVAGCVFGEERTMIFHAGDSRVYRFDGTYFTQMTQDHSEVQMLVDMGALTPDLARTAPNRHVIQRCIGLDCPPPQIYCSGTPIHKGETYLLCSDGLWEVLTEEDITAVLCKEQTLAAMADELVELALAKGSDDNITVCICRRSPENTDREGRFVFSAVEEDKI